MDPLSNAASLKISILSLNTKFVVDRLKRPPPSRVQSLILSFNVETFCHHWKALQMIPTTYLPTPPFFFAFTSNPNTSERKKGIDCLNCHHHRRWFLLFLTVVHCVKCNQCDCIRRSQCCELGHTVSGTQVAPLTCRGPRKEATANDRFWN